MKAYSLCIFGLFILGACNQVQGHDEREEIRILGVANRMLNTLYGLLPIQQDKITENAARIALNSLKNKSNLCSVQKKQKIKQLHGQFKDIENCLDTGNLVANITYLENNATNLMLEASADALKVAYDYVGCLRSSKPLDCTSKTTTLFDTYLTTVINDAGTVSKQAVDLVADFILDTLACLQQPSSSSVFNEIKRIMKSPCLKEP